MTLPACHASRFHGSRLALVVRGCEPLAALGAATLEHELAAFCAHPNAKAVSLGPAAVVRLKSPLHVSMLLYKRFHAKE